MNKENKPKSLLIFRATFKGFLFINKLYKINKLVSWYHIIFRDISFKILMKLNL